MKDFQKYASSHGINTNLLCHYQSSMGYYNPAIIEERKLNAVAMDVFSRLMMERIIFIGDTITDDVANIIQAQLLYLSSMDPKSDISIYLNTPGGSVSAGLGIYDTIQLISPEVSTICTGMAASMGAVILCAGKNGKRAALPHSRIMVHQPLGGVSGQASDIIIEAREIELLRKELYEIISVHAGKPIEQVFSDCDRNYWMSAEDAKQYGLIDKVLSKV